MNKNKFKIFALDGPWGPSSGNNNRGSGGFSGGNNDSIDDLLKDLKNKYGENAGSVILSKIKNKEAILDSIKDFLGKGK